MVSKIANIATVNYTIEYFHSRVKTEIETWPDGILADFARIVELLMEFGPNLRMPHSRAIGGGPFRIEAPWSGRHRAGVLLFRHRSARRDTPRIPEKNTNYS